MPDERQWRLVVVEFQAMRANVPGLISEAFVHEYHSLLIRMAAASEEDLDTFRIPLDALRPRVLSTQRGSYSRGLGSTQYSKDKFCDGNLFQRKIDAITAYLPTLESTVCRPKISINPKDYWSMNDAQLESLARDFNIGGYGGQHGAIDRDIIIKSLLRRDSVMQPPRPAANSITNHGTIVGSTLQQGSHGSSATVNYSAQGQIELIEQIRKAIPQLSLTSDQMQEIQTDLATTEMQLTSGRPKKAIINECWTSVRSILEKAAGSLVAAPLLYELSKLINHLH